MPFFDTRLNDTKPVRLLVCGPRDFADMHFIINVLNNQFIGKVQPSVLINGNARGVDKLARVWAKGRGIRIEDYDAKWCSMGRGAGPRRNQEMLDVGRPTAAVAFRYSSRETKGTKDMIHRLQKAHIPLEIIEIGL